MKKIFLLLFLITAGLELQAQSWTEVVKKIASDKAERDEFGYSVALSDTIAVIGAIGHNYDAAGGNNMNNAGAAYILKRDGSGNWNEVQKIVASDRASGDNFGRSVSISGTTIVIGAPKKDVDTFAFAGAAYIFEPASNGVWNQVKKIVAYDKEEIAYFGYCVAISGNYVIVGAPEKDDTSIFWGYDVGAAYIYERNSSGAWNQVQKILASDKAGGLWFSESVSISGTTALVGSDNNNAAYIFERAGNGVWSETQKLVSADVHVGDYFGCSVAISGMRAIIGADGENEDVSGANYLDRSGSAYIFERNSNGIWNQVQKIVASDRDSMVFFGQKVTISDTTIVIGAQYEKKNASGGNSLYKCGAAYVYKKNGNTWNQVQKIVASDRAAHDRFSFGGVAVSGETIIVGCPEKHYGSGSSTLEYAGAVYIYEHGTTSVNSISFHNNLSLFPNPSSGRFTVHASCVVNEPVTISITNLFGQKIYETQSHANKDTEISLDAPAGIYFVEVTTARKKYTQKIIIE